MATTGNATDFGDLTKDDGMPMEFKVLQEVSLLVKKQNLRQVQQ